ncbi:MAG: hypothetical protein NTV52_01845 [Acidobacteria bacterium]|nr:hypothetical protein [Acidobacteriota bacterium]
MITFQIPISDELLPNLDSRARNAGLNREQFLSELLCRELSTPDGLDEILAGFRREVSASSLSDAELTEVFSAARTETGSHRI